MKRELLYITFATGILAVTSAPLPLCAEEVTGEEAMSAVAGWANVKEALGAEFSAQATTNVLAYTAKDGKGKYYVVNLAGGGFVVTSGDTAMEPILAYSKEGVWNTNAAENPLMAMLEIDVAAMMAELCSANTTNAAQATASVQQQGGGLRLAGINGTLKLYGGETLGGITNVLDKAEFDDAKFSRGDTAQTEFQQDGTNTFYKAIIE